MALGGMLPARFGGGTIHEGFLRETAMRCNRLRRNGKREMGRARWEATTTMDDRKGLGYGNPKRSGQKMCEDVIYAANPQQRSFGRKRRLREFQRSRRVRCNPRTGVSGMRRALDRDPREIPVFQVPSNLRDVLRRGTGLSGRRVKP